MLRLKEYTTEPPGGWTYRDPDLKIVIRGGGFNGLLQTIRQLRSVNHLTIPDNLTAIVEDYICRHTDRSFVANPDENFLGMVTRQAMLAAADRVIRTIGGREQPERAVTCTKCPFNVATVCMTCDGFDSFFESRFPQLPLCRVATVHVCQVDALPGMVTVNANLEQLRSALVPRTMYPDHCWKKEPPHDDQ